MRPLSCGSFENITDEDEFILLYDLDTSKNFHQIECFTSDSTLTRWML